MVHHGFLYIPVGFTCTHRHHTCHVYRLTGCRCGLCFPDPWFTHDLPYPWALKNISILPGIYREVIKILRDKIALGTYEPSSSSYRSKWFTVLKKNSKLRIIHDLQPLNAVTICDSALIPYTEQLTEMFGGHSCYGLLDLFVGYDKHLIYIDSRDFTTFPTPFGAY